MNTTNKRVRIWMDRTRHIDPSFLEKGDVIDGLYIEGFQAWNVLDATNKVATLKTLTQSSAGFIIKAHPAAIQMNCRSIYKKQNKPNK